MEYRLFYQRHLPHFQPPGATQFITFRLAGSLPPEVLRRLTEETRIKQREIDLLPDPHTRKEAASLAQKRLFAHWDAALDTACQNPCWLSNHAVADMVCGAMHYRDGRVFTLEAYCVMPNHVHLVCTPLSETGVPIPLPEIMQSLKGLTARKANLILGRQGEFWQHESYDHVVRDLIEFNRIIEYVMMNPVRAGLSALWVYRRANC